MESLRLKLNNQRDTTYAKHLSYNFVISSAINLKTLLHGSHVFFSNLLTKGPTGPPKILLYFALVGIAHLVRVPTPAVSIGTEVANDTTQSSAAERAATSSKLLY